MGNKSIYCKKNMIYPVSIGGFLKRTEHYCIICPVSVKRSGFKAKSVFDDPN